MGRRLRFRFLSLLLGASLALTIAEVAVRAMGIVRNVGPSFSQFHEVDGVALKKSFRCDRVAPEFTMAFSTNALGYRGPEEVVSKHHLICLGDSFTMGYGVDDGAEYPALLRGKLPAGWQVLNAGIGGTGTGRWLHVLDRELPRLRPAIAVLQVCVNDYGDNLRERLFSLDAQGRLQGHTPTPPGLLRRTQAWIDAIPGLPYLHLIGLGRQVAAVHRDGSPPLPQDTGAAGTPAIDDGRALTHALIREAIRRCRAHGTEVLLFGCALEPTQEADYRSFAAGERVVFVTMPVREAAPELYFRNDGHWNVAGQRRAAELVFETLQAEPFASRLHD